MIKIQKRAAQTAPQNEKLFEAVGALEPHLEHPADAARVAALIAEGCNPDAVDDFGLPPLWRAVESDRVDVAKALLEAGADPRFRNRNGISLFSIAAARGFEKIARTLLDAGAELELGRDGGARLLLSAVLTGDCDLTKRLLDAGAESNAGSALWQAAGAGHLKIVRMLLTAGADPNFTNSAGLTPLYLAADRGYLDVAQALLAGDADPNGAQQGPAPLWAASANARSDVLKLLLDAGADPACLGWDADFMAVAVGDAEALKERINNGLDLDKRDPLDRTPFVLAVDMGACDKAALLLEAGARLDEPDHRGHWPLNYAIRKGDAKMLAWLLEHGHPVNVRSGNGETPLKALMSLRAPEEKQPDLARILFSYGADPLERDGQIAALSGVHDLNLIRVFLEAGGDPSDISARRELLGYGPRVELRLPHAILQGSRREFCGQANPERITDGVWIECVRHGVDPADVAWRNFHDDKMLGPYPHWSYYDRSGMSLTPLPDGRFVEIGGAASEFFEGPDGYIDQPNADYCIYNDVFVHDGKGGCEILLYPRTILTPVDYHTATLAGSWIYIIGGFGYEGERRLGETPVWRLSVDDWRIEPMTTTGRNPGWIGRHRARIEGESIVVWDGVVEVPAKNSPVFRNFTPPLKGRWRLDLRTLEWEPETL